ncbi:MAG: D-amino-acid transaminase [Rhodospirillales bacterium]
MGRIAYVNGRYLPHRAARVHVEDRGYQFADGVYEVFALKNGAIVDVDRHLTRLTRSLVEIDMAWPMAPAALMVVLRRLVRYNGSPGFGALYMQITRGAAPRNHAFPPGVKPSLVATVRSLPPFDVAATRRGVAVVTLPDLRWRRADIKSVSLLANVLAKQRALLAGAYEAWLVDDGGRVTEGTASNAWIVTADGTLVTHPADHAILAGITRAVVLERARSFGLAVVERPFAVDEAKQATEAFLTSTTSFVKPVIRIDDATIGDGKMGKVSGQLLDAYLAHIEAEGGCRR